MHSFTLPEGQEWLIPRMQRLGYKADEGGVCAGLAHMAKQAILSQDFKTFKLRLKLIHNIPLDQFNNRIEFLKQKRLSIVERVKRELTNLQYSPSYNRLVQTRVDEIISKLPEQEQLELDIPTFFDGLEYYHNFHLHREISEKARWYQVYPKRLLDTLVVSRKIEAAGGIQKIKDSSGAYSDFSGIYQKQDLIKYFDGLRKAISASYIPIKEPICLMLDSSNHSITIGYDPNHAKNPWIYLNPNALPGKRLSNSEAIANRLLYEFTNNGVCTFSTQIYTTKTNEAAAKNCISLWKNQNSWQEIHTVNSQKAILFDWVGATWLYIAADSGDYNAVKKLLAIGANPNQTVDGKPALYTAAKNGHFKVVHALLNAQANPNVQTANGISPLNVATENGQFDIVQALLTYGANPNKPNCFNETPLFTSSKYGYLDIVNALLKAGADPNQQSNGSTSLLSAVENGHLDIVKALLAHGATKIPVNIDIPRLQSIAKANHTENVMQMIINNQYQYTSTRFFPSSIVINLEDIANLRGDRVMANLLKDPFNTYSYGGYYEHSFDCAKYMPRSYFL